MTANRGGRQGERNMRLLRLLHEFEECPADYLDVSRRADFCESPVPASVWDSTRARRHLSRYILGALGLGPTGPIGAREQALVLLDAARLRRLSLHVAACAASTQVRHSLLRDDVMAWREWLTPDAFAFAQRTATLLPVSVPAGIRIDRELTAESFGLRWFARAAAAWPAEVAGRFLLKLPRREAEQPSDADAGLAARLAASVVSIMEPQWCSSLATTKT